MEIYSSGERLQLHSLSVCCNVGDVGIMSVYTTRLLLHSLSLSDDIEKEGEVATETNLPNEFLGNVFESICHIKYNLSLAVNLTLTMLCLHQSRQVDKCL